ncbi:MAG: ferritin family protein [Candidatus Aminicenantaceae bacterium]
MSDISRTSVKTLLGIAVRAEIDSSKIYSNIAKKVSNPLLQEKFKMLAFEEKKHKNVLEKISKFLFKGEEIQIPDKTDERLLPSIKMSPSSSLVDIIYQAMEAEKAAQIFYETLSKRFQKPQKDILIYLGKVEKSHYMMLKSEYALAQEFEDYAEKDIDKIIT